MSDAQEPDPSTLMDIYARKSVKVNGRRGELSTSAQESRGRDWGDWNKLAVRKVWVDKISASKDIRRPDYTRALLALAAGEVSTLWCYKLDRFDRKGALAVLTTLETLNGGRIIFGEDGLDSSDPNHRRMIMWKAEDAREESDRISQRVTDTKTWQRNHGEWVSGRVGYGLRADEDRKLVADTTFAIPGVDDSPTKADIAVRIFREAGEGRSLRDIARGLDFDGVSTPMGGGRWNPTSIHRMIHNPSFSGWQIIKLGSGPGTIYVDPKGRRVRVGDGLVSDKDRQAAARVVAGHTTPAPLLLGSERGRARHLLTDLLTCSGCRRAMPRMSRSYSCMSTQGGTTCPAPSSAYAPPLEAHVVSMWLTRLSTAEPEDPLLVVVADRWGALTKPEETADLEEARGMLKAAEAQMERLLRDRRAGLYEGPASRFFEPAWEEVNADMDTARSTLRAIGGGTVDIGFLLEEEYAREAWEVADLPLRRDLLRLAIDRVEVRKATNHGAFDGPARVTIKWATIEE